MMVEFRKFGLRTLTRAIVLIALLVAPAATTIAAAEPPHAAANQPTLAADLAQIRDTGSPAIAAVAAVERLAARLEASQADAAAAASRSSSSPQAEALAGATAQEGLAALRAAVDDPRRPVVLAAADALARRTDLAGLGAIVAAAARGALSDIEAVELVALARREVGAKYLGFYLNSGSRAAKGRAAELLARIPAQRSMLRQRLLATSDWAEPVRAAAARALMIEDAESRAAAPGLLVAPTTPFSVCLAIVEGLATTAATGEQEAAVLSKAAAECRLRNPGADADLVRMFDAATAHIAAH